MPENKGSKLDSQDLNNSFHQNSLESSTDGQGSVSSNSPERRSHGPRENPEIRPEPIVESKITKTLETDVVIIGAGIAGLTAARAASEAGASVVVVEKARKYQHRSGQFGIIDSTFQRDLGIRIDKNAAILESLKQMGYRADQRMWKYWADHSGADFDWMMELAPDAEVISEDALSYDKDKITLQPYHFPTPPGYNPDEEHIPAYPTVICILPNQGKILERVYIRCLEKGCSFLFSTWARQLIRYGNKGRVEGVICEDISGSYTKIAARKGVVLASGDYGNNEDMVSHYVPWAKKYECYFPNRDAKGDPTNTGDGQRMGIWVGAKMEDGPHAPMTHAMGGPLGINAFFMCNLLGKRFINEDVGGAFLSNAIYRQPGCIAWQIFDDDWPEQIVHMNISHGCVNFCVTPEKMPRIKGARLTRGKPSYITREDVINGEGVIVADTIESLAEAVGFDKTSREAFYKSINNYNELCKSGIDSDFGKVGKRLFPIEKRPFYAVKLNPGKMLVCMGGLTCDPETGNVLDKAYEPIAGLYAAGNTMGGRFLVDYPMVTAGVSHGFALTYGRLVGTTVANLY